MKSLPAVTLSHVAMPPGNIVSYIVAHISTSIELHTLQTPYKMNSLNLSLDHHNIISVYLPYTKESGSPFVSSLKAIGMCFIVTLQYLQLIYSNN